jgi:hypothetical protein
MRTQGIKRLLVLNDGAAYGRAIAQSLTQRARGFDIELVRTRRPIRITDRNLIREIVASKAEAIFLGALTGPIPVTTWNRLAAAIPRLELLGPSGLDTPQFAAAISTPAQPRTFLDEPGPEQANLPPAGRNFLADFTAAYGHPPQSAAFFGYAATQAVLDAIHRAGGKGQNRAVIAKIFFRLQAIPSVLGTYSIDGGTATITRLSSSAPSRTEGADSTGSSSSRLKRLSRPRSHLVADMSPTTNRPRRRLSTDRPKIIAEYLESPSANALEPAAPTRPSSRAARRPALAVPDPERGAAHARRR